MGSNSNRGENKSEKLARFVEYARKGDTSCSSWQTTKGSKIRGEMGVKRGNQFIADMKKYR